ncbi:MAG: ABC transporter substrate-binding protein [Gammaproteobacteria bacterium]|nr:ABC transporter substrate-binding protein [Gammaproteobacteria bacterium]
MSVEETFFRMLRHKEFDAAEMSMSSYTVTMFDENRPFIAIPAFPSRIFRHSAIFINKNSGIKEPKDLIGKRVGCPEYQMTAPVWIRGIMSDEYGVPVDSVHYLTGGEEEPNRPEKIPLNLPENIKVDPIGEGKTLATMLESGELDALYTARAPLSFYQDDSNIQRLFPNYPEVERDYFNKTNIFPIMHCVVIRRDVYEANPWAAQSLLKAFTHAQKVTYNNIKLTGSPMIMLPWVVSLIEEARKTMGEDFWPYGFEKNRETIATFLRYHHEQGLSQRQLQPEELFAPESMESFVI